MARNPTTRSGRRQKNPDIEGRREFLFLNYDDTQNLPNAATKKLVRRHVQLHEPTAPGAPAQPFSMTNRGYLRPSVSKSKMSTSETVPNTSLKLYKQPAGSDPFASTGAASDVKCLRDLLVWHLFRQARLSLTQVTESCDPVLSQCCNLMLRGLWDVAMAEPTVFHILEARCIRSLPGATNEELSKMYFYHRTISLRFLREALHGLRYPSLAKQGALAFAIAHQCSLAIMEHNLAECQGHLKALKGICTTDVLGQLSPDLWIAIVMTDLAYATWTFCEPQLPYYLHPTCPITEMQLDPVLFTEAQCKAHAVVPLLPRTTSPGLDVAAMYSLFRRLFLYVTLSDLPSAQSAILLPWLGMVYDLKYNITVCIAKAYATVCKEKEEEEEEERETTDISCLAVAGVLIASRITANEKYMARHHTLDEPELVVTTQIVNQLFYALKRYVSVLELWRSSASVESLVWVIFTAVSFVPLLDGAKPLHDIRHSWRLLRHAMDALNLSTIGDLERVLKRFPWVQGWSDTKLVAVWEVSKNGSLDDAAIESNALDRTQTIAGA